MEIICFNSFYTILGLSWEDFIGIMGHAFLYLSNCFLTLCFVLYEIFLNDPVVL